MDAESFYAARSRALSIQYVSMVLVILACALSNMKEIGSLQLKPHNVNVMLKKAAFHSSTRAPLKKAKSLPNLAKVSINLDSTEAMRSQRTVIAAMLTAHDLGLHFKVGLGRPGSRPSLSRFTHSRLERGARLLDWLQSQGVPKNAISVGWSNRRPGSAQAILGPWRQAKEDQ